MLSGPQIQFQMYDSIIIPVKECRSTQFKNLCWETERSWETGRQGTELRECTAQESLICKICKRNHASNMWQRFQVIWIPDGHCGSKTGLGFKWNETEKDGGNHFWVGKIVMFWILSIFLFCLTPQVTACSCFMWWQLCSPRPVYFLNKNVWNVGIFSRTHCIQKMGML
jgi:hypothetical protein